jgi:pyridoxamine 5'-phosphate oxidase
MNIQDCIKFSNENPICYLATAENDQPHVRALGFWFADETGFYFQTSTIKEFENQLEKTQKLKCVFISMTELSEKCLELQAKSNLSTILFLKRKY